MIVRKSTLLTHYFNLIYQGASCDEALEKTANQFGVTTQCVRETLGEKQ